MKREKPYKIWLDNETYSAVAQQAKHSNLSMRDVMVTFILDGLHASQPVFPLGKFEAALKIAGADSQLAERILKALQE